jgi:hypothetical protein
LAVGDTYNLFSATSGSGSFSSIVGPIGVTFAFNAASGVLSVTAVPPTTGTNIIFSASGGKLNLSWPASYLGYALQSNSINLLNTNDWFTIAGSTTNLSASLPIGTNTAVFFRLQFP